MSRNPLLVTLMAIVLRRSGSDAVPKWTRSALYADVFKTLLSGRHRAETSDLRTTTYQYEATAADSRS